MARPTTPLISRDKATLAALRIIDTAGLKGLSMRALGAALGVNGASLYHHFENKEAIEIAVAELVLDTARLPVAPEDDWRTSLVDAHVAYRNALLRHPNALPLLLRTPRQPAARAYWENLAAGARQDGLPDDALVLLVRGLQGHTVGSALRAQRAGEPHDAPLWEEISDVPDDASGFAAACQAMIEGFLAQHDVPIGNGPRPRSGVRRARRS